LRLLELIDAEHPVRWRRSSSGGAACRMELAVAIAEAQPAGAGALDVLERLRADRAEAALRAVAGTRRPGSWRTGSGPPTSV